MKRKRLSVEQIVAVLKQAEVGVPVGGVVPASGDHRADLLSMEEAACGIGDRQQLQDENTRLKKLVAELSLDKTMLQDVLAKKF